MQSVKYVALFRGKKYLTWFHRRRTLYFSHCSSSLRTLIHDIVLLIVKNWIFFIYLIKIWVFKFNLKRRKRIIDSDFPKRLYFLNYMDFLHAFSFTITFVIKKKSLCFLVQKFLLKAVLENIYGHATTISFSHFSFLNLIFLEGHINC